MVEHKFVLLETVTALWILVSLLIKLFRILLKWNCIQDQNYAISAAMLVTWAGAFICENFHPGYRDLGCKNRDLGKQASPASHMNTSIF